MRRMIRDEVRQVMGNAAPNSNRFQQRKVFGHILLRPKKAHPRHSFVVGTVRIR